MTFEQAVYFKLLLICGFNDELNDFVEKSLYEQTPIANIIMELSMAQDEKKLLLVLNEYLRQINDEDIDYNIVFNYVLSFLRKIYKEEIMAKSELAGLMHKISLLTERYTDEPWQTMFVLGSLYDEAESGYIEREEYLRQFDNFIMEGICLKDYPNSNPKESFFKKIIRFFIPYKS